MLTIDDPEIERLARELAARSGKSVEEILRAALQARVGAISPGTDAEAPPEEQARRAAVLDRIEREMAVLPELDPRSADEILGYDENGLPI